MVDKVSYLLLYLAQQTLFHLVQRALLHLAQQALPNWPTNCKFASGRDSVMEQLPAHHINKTKQNKNVRNLLKLFPEED